MTKELIHEPIDAAVRDVEQERAARKEALTEKVNKNKGEAIS